METLAFLLLVAMQRNSTGVVSVSMGLSNLWLPSNDKCLACGCLVTTAFAQTRHSYVGAITTTYALWHTVSGYGTGRLKAWSSSAGRVNNSDLSTASNGPVAHPVCTVGFFPRTEKRPRHKADHSPPTPRSRKGTSMSTLLPTPREDVH
jgi:hypothetical protein